MSYKSRISNLKKFSWTVSSLAIAAFSAPLAMAAQDELPTVEIHFEVLDKFLAQDVNMQPQGAAPFSTKASEPLKPVKPAKKAVAQKLAEVKKPEEKKVDLEAEAAKPVSTHKFKLTAKEKAAVAKGEPAPLAIPSSKMKEMPLQMPPDLQPTPAPVPAAPASKEKASAHKEHKAANKPQPKAEPVPAPVMTPPPAHVQPVVILPPKGEAILPPPPVMQPVPEAAPILPTPPKAEPVPPAPTPVAPPSPPVAQPPVPPAPVTPPPAPVTPPSSQVPLIMPEAAVPAPAPKIPDAQVQKPVIEPAPNTKIEPVPQPLPMPTAALPEKSEPQKPLISPMPPAPTPEDEFAKALNAPVAPKEAIAPPPPAPMPVVPEVKKEPVPAPAPETGKGEAVKAAPQGWKSSMTIPFISTETDLPLAFEGELKNLAARVKKSNEHLTLIAYASDSADQATTARRVSLARVLAVRAYLIEQGVDKLNINVQAEGSKNPGGEPNRVDILIGEGKSK
jgi:outer membrane protein OmpA-like peptidoglycan-associated protein